MLKKTFMSQLKPDLRGMLLDWSALREVSLPA